MSDPEFSPNEETGPGTKDEWYTNRLKRANTVWWKRLLPDPYRWHIRSLQLGYVLDVGCGIGRCLAFNDGNGVGIDHNPTSIERCRERGLEAYTPSEFDSLNPGLFDSLLLSHVLEHTTPEESEELLRGYLRYVRPGGKIVLITPQPAGQRSDPTHVRYLGREDLAHELEGLGTVQIRTRSFPFPGVVGRAFRYNENVAWGQIPGGISF
jgi:SAM-dependent methyltransferase